MDAILAILFVVAVVCAVFYALTRKPKSVGWIRPRGPRSPVDPRMED